jgi:hypothetical protein
MMNTEIENDTGISPPKKCEMFECNQCGMATQATKDCNCKEDEHVHFRCCGQEMVKA